MFDSENLAYKLALSVLIITCLALFLWADTMLISNQNRSNSNYLKSSNATSSRDQQISGNYPPRTVKLLCWIMSVDSQAGREKSSMSLQTWARRCDKVLVVRNGTEFGEHNGVLVLPMKEESRAHLWHKVIKAFSHLYNNHLNEFDWFMKADDDTYVLVDNLKHFLAGHSSDEPVHFGYKFKPYVKQGYFSGGSGYVLSREALRLLVEEGFKGNKTGCDLKDDENEDILIGRCLEAVGVEAGDTRDAKGKPTFLPLSPFELLSEQKIDENFWYTTYAFYGKPEPGKNCCSNQPISFHYIEPKMMLFIDWLLYDVKRQGTTMLCPGSMPTK